VAGSSCRVLDWSNHGLPERVHPAHASLVSREDSWTSFKLAAPGGQVKSSSQVASGRASRAAALAPSLSGTGSAVISCSHEKEQGSGSVMVSGAAKRHERRPGPTLGVAKIRAVGAKCVIDDFPCLNCF
jgi:hypothetical protein